jgi:hypothetical protein
VTEGGHSQSLCLISFPFCESRRARLPSGMSSFSMTSLLQPSV